MEGGWQFLPPRFLRVDLFGNGELRIAFFAEAGAAQSSSRLPASIYPAPSDVTTNGGFAPLPQIQPESQIRRTPNP